MIHKYSNVSIPSSTKDDELSKQSGEKLQSTSSEKQLEGKREKSDE